MPALSSSTHTADQVIAALGLKILDQEGGFFRRTAESGVWVTPTSEEKGEPRRAYSVIYALLTPEGFSALHRLRHDEIWCWHAGDALESLRLYPDGRGKWVVLGGALDEGQRLQDIVPAGVWQGTRLRAGGKWALVSCIMAPEFRWQEFDLGDDETLRATYPEFGDGIAALTRAQPVGGIA